MKMVTGTSASAVLQCPWNSYLVEEFRSHSRRNVMKLGAPKKGQFLFSLTPPSDEGYTPQCDEPAGPLFDCQTPWTFAAIRCG